MDRFGEQHIHVTGAYWPRLRDRANHTDPGGYRRLSQCHQDDPVPCCPAGTPGLVLVLMANQPVRTSPSKLIGSVQVAASFDRLLARHRGHENQELGSAQTKNSEW